MPRTRDLAVAAGFAIVLIFGAAFVAEIRAAIGVAFPGRARAIIGGTVVVMIGAAITIAATRIRGSVRGPVRERRALRYLALAAALVVGALFARGLRTGDADTDVVESFHFVEYGLFFQTVHLGYEVHDSAIGTFRSRYSRVQLESAAKERMDRWREETPPVVGRLSREDQYLSEGLWHVRRRNQAMAAGDVFTAWRENRILETFYAPLLETGTEERRAGFTWPAEQRAQAARVAAGDNRPYVSDAAPVPIYDWPKRTFWMMIALAISMILGMCMAASSKEQSGP